MIHKNTFTSESALHWLEQGKKWAKIAQSTIPDDLQSNEFEPEDQLEDFGDNAPFQPPQLFLSLKMPVFSESSIQVDDHDPWILYVESDEVKAFDKAVIPRAMFLAHGKQVVGIEGGIVPDGLDPERHLALIILDAGSLSEKRFLDILRCEEWEPISKLLVKESTVQREYIVPPTNTALEVIFYIHRIHDAKVNLARLMTSFLDGRFCGGGSCDRSANTTVIFSGVWDQPNLGRVITPAITKSRATPMRVL